MPLTGEYEPSPSQRTAGQVAAYEASGGREANTLPGTDLPVVIVTMHGNKSGKLRKVALMRVEHDGEYLLVASKGGAPEHPVWYHNLVANSEVTVQDGPQPVDMTVRELAGEERAIWWGRAVDAFPNYAEYQTKTDRLIPILLASTS